MDPQQDKVQQEASQEPTGASERLNPWASDIEPQVPPNILLRDLFAAVALHGEVMSEVGVVNNEKTAKWCYEMADAMLAQRKESIDGPSTG